MRAAERRRCSRIRRYVRSDVSHLGMFPAASHRCPVCGWRLHHCRVLVYSFNFVRESSSHDRADRLQHLRRNTSDRRACIHHCPGLRRSVGNVIFPLAYSFPASNGRHYIGAARFTRASKNQDLPVCLCPQRRPFTNGRCLVQPVQLRSLCNQRQRNSCCALILIKEDEGSFGGGARGAQGLISAVRFAPSFRTIAGSIAVVFMASSR